ncbi:hypothetical protein BDF20DRAFT_891837 [Mycotypha africana]|uniref:uncharacterized protein n=1 Tax=Mycotypha africana TaxID=64632 RepID=UPI0022FFD99E|nr:uncharacterized protein BDF20DRAFT_891837 [Mycotypha africana]KAI8968861.1 hypothetical protein BDF20DRAFT_891837 [Mycotypha africana]
MVQWLQKKVGVAFPWPKYYQISLPGLRSAMENISLVTWVDTFIQDETLALERQLFTDCVNIHEMGHTYFGDLLVIRHFEHVWLKESWATYIESCWLQDNVSKDEFCYEMYQNACGYFEECRKYMRPIVTRRYDHSWDMFDRHTYPGGAWRIHMLRQLLGDEAFWMGVHIYVERFAKKTVQTSDFQNCLEEASGLNLTRFFEEWIYSKGYPALKGQYSYNDLQNNTVTLTLTQTQHMNQADIPLFGFDIEVMIKTNKDSECTCLLTFDRAATVTACIALPKGEKPAQVLIDPHNKILHTLDMPSVDRDVLINTAKSCPHLVQRIWAYSELIQSGSRPALKAVRELIKQESFYGVRIECAKKLSELNSVFSLEILSELLDNEKEPMAMAPIAEACRHKDDHLRYALRRMLDKSATLPYRAHAYALIALGCQQNADDLPFLLEVAKDENKVGQHGIIRGGALKALGFHRSKEAFEYLLGRVGYHKEPLRSRPMAIQGLAHAAEWQSDRLRKAAIEELASLTRDPNIQIRMEAVEALVQLRANTYADAIEATKHMYPVDDWPWMDRQLRALNNADGDLSEIGLQKKAIEKLENRVKELEEALSAQKA